MRSAAVVLVLVGACCFGAARVGAVPAPVQIAIKTSCVSTINCESFSFSLKNGGSDALNGLTIQIAAPNTITAFSIGGQPAAKPTGVQNAWSVFPATIPVGATVTGSGTVSAPLSNGISFKIYTTPNGFTTAIGQDVTLENDLQKLGQRYIAKFGNPMVSLVSPTFRALLSGHGTTLLGNDWIEYDRQAWEKLLHVGTPVGAVKETFHGTVTGPGATVDVAIKEQVGPNSCRWLTDKNGTFLKDLCKTPKFLPADMASAKWKYELFRPLPPGHYTLEARATSGGVSGTDFSAAQHNLVQLDVKLGK